MKVSNEKQTEKVQELVLEITKEDYVNEVESALKKQRRSAQIPGFRVGMAPMGMIKRLYEKSLVAEKVNEMASNTLYNYFKDNNIEIIFEPMLDEEKSVIDFDNSESFTFVFEFAIRPTFEIDFAQLPVVKLFKINAEEKEIESVKDELRRRHGTFTTPEIIGEEDNVSVSYGENHSGFMYISSLTEDAKKEICGKKIGDVISLSLKSAFTSEEDLKNFLHIKNEEYDDKNDYLYDLTVSHIGRMELAEVNEAFFKVAFSDGSVTNEEEFTNYAKSQVELRWKEETDKKFTNDAIETLINNIEIELPEDFVRRLILKNNPEIGVEKLNNEFVDYLKSFRWQLIEGELVSKNDIQVTMDDVKEYIRNFFIQNYFHQFNRADIEDQLNKLVEQSLAKQEDVKKIYDQLFDKRISELLREKMNVEEENGTLNQFIEFISGKSVEQNDKADVTSAVGPKKSTKAKAKKETETSAEEGSEVKKEKKTVKKTPKKENNE